MMAENPNWWSMQQEQQELPSSSSFLSSTVMPSQYILGSSSPPLSNNSMDDNKELPHSWSQLMGGLSGGCDEYRFGMSHFQQRKVENWEEENNIPHPCMKFPVIDVKKEFSSNQDRGFCGQGGEEFQALRPPLASAAWSPQVLPVSSPRSCVTTSSTSNNILNFANKADENNQHHHLPDITSESNSTASGGLTKKPRVQASSSQPPLKVRKEKLGDRITALHQLVSPFGKTDTASVLLEAIGYIRFFHGQIEALSSPYMGSASANMRSQQSDNQDTPRNLRSRGLCLVPISCTLQVENDNGADYWAPSFGGGF